MGLGLLTEETELPRISGVVGKDLYDLKYAQFKQMNLESALTR